MKEKQAVVIIHGIGEQKPMDVLRRFVRAVLPTPEQGEAFHSKPDRMSELFELRRLQSRGRPATHFYEYYWAYAVEGTEFFDVLRWLAGLTRRRSKDVPPSARALWLTGRFVAALIAIAILLGVFSALQRWIDGLRAFGGLSILVLLMWALLQSVVVLYLGDAARYLSPRPKNIRLRQTIRANGIELLRTLHERGEYDRIIVVGHSLGSVIGYDILTHLWQGWNESLPALEKPEIQAKVRACLKTRVNPQPKIRDDLPNAAASLAKEPRSSDVTNFQRAQRAAWCEQRLFENPWKVTDFITIGSPLVHAMLLVASDRDDFESRKRQRELPTCPPQRDDKGFSYGALPALDIGEKTRFTPLILHHAALFAVTRWTNLYFPARWGFLGDLVGGPLQGEFGFGIRDVKVCCKKWRGLLSHTPFSHTAYWLPGDDMPVRGADPVPALAAVRAALALNDLRQFKPAGWDQLLGAEGEPAVGGSPA